MSGRVDLLGVGEVLEVAQQEPQRVAQAAIAVGGAFQDLLADAQVNRVVGLRHPEAQDVGTVFVDHRLRGDGVAERFGHLHALFIQREAVGQHAAVGRTALGAAGLQHRGMEPAAMLVGALEIQVGDAIVRPVRAVAQHEGMGGARVKPHVQHVIDLFIIRRIDDAIQHPFLESLHKPDIGAFCLERGLDAGVDLGVAQQEVGVGRFARPFW